MPSPDFSNPIPLLMVALLSADAEEARAAARHTARALAAPEFFAVLRDQALTPLVYHTLTRQPREVAGPLPCLDELRRDYIRAYGKAAAQEKELRLALVALAAAGVQPVLLKGADLRRRLYGDPVLRHMGDVDLLIAAEHLDRCVAALRGLGYTLESCWEPPRPGFRERFSNELTFLPPPGRHLVVEPHWDIRALEGFYRLPGPALLEQAVVWGRGLEAVRVLAPEHLLLHLCLHTFQEAGTVGLQKMVDLALAVTRLPLDWPRFLAEMARFQVGQPVSLILSGVAQMLPEALPPEVRQRLAALRPGPAERLALSGRLGFLPAFALAFARDHDLKDALFYCAARVWPSRSYLQANFGTGGRRAYLRSLLREFLPSLAGPAPRRLVH